MITVCQREILTLSVWVADFLSIATILGTGILGKFSFHIFIKVTEVFFRFVKVGHIKIYSCLVSIRVC